MKYSRQMGMCMERAQYPCFISHGLNFTVIWFWLIVEHRQFKGLRVSRVKRAKEMNRL